MSRYKSDTMTQCRMQRHTGQGTFETTGWIESRFAKLGNFLEDEDTDIWEVVEVFTTRAIQEILDHERDYKTQRKASDI